MSCVKIELKATYPDFVSDNGRTYLDTDEAFETSFLKQLSQLTDINEITIDGALGTTLPNTPKNFHVLSSVVNPNTLDNEFLPLDVVIWVGSANAIHSQLYIKGRQDRFDIDIRPDSDFWAIQLKDLDLVDLELGEYEFSRANLEAIWSGYTGYQDTDDNGLNFPVVWYGDTLRRTTGGLYDFGVEDLRPWFSLLWLLQKIFCHIGWVFSSPVLESTFGRKLYSYLFYKKLQEDGDNLDNHKFRASRSDEWDVLAYTGGSLGDEVDIPFDVEISDPGDHYDPVTGRFTSYCIADFSATVHYTFEIQQDLLEFDSDCIFLDLVLVTVNGEAVSITDGGAYKRCDSIEPNFLRTANLVAYDVPVVPGSYVAVRASYSSRNDTKSFRIQANSIFWNEPRFAYIQAGDNVEIAKMIDSEYGSLDFVRGVAHLFNFKFETDFTLKTVTAYCPYDQEWYTEDIEGFIQKDQIVDITNDVTKDSVKVSIPKNVDIDRYYLFEFKNSTDNYIQQMELPDDEPLFSKKVDYGDVYKDKIKKFTNPFFEPTKNDFIPNVGWDGLLPDMPICLDNDSNKFSYNINPRVLYCDLESQYYQKEGVEVYEQVSINMFVNSSYFIWMYGYQEGNAAIDYSGGEPTFTEHVLIYGSNTNDLYNKVYREWMFNFYLNMVLEPLVEVKVNEFFKWDFRSLYQFKYMGRDILAMTGKINNYRPCRNIPTPISFYPLKQTTQVCDETLLINFCQNNPVLVITYVDSTNCYVFSVGGSSTSTVDTTTFQYRYEDESSWTTITASPPQLCDPTGAFYVRVVQTFEDTCPALTRTRYVDPCGNSPILAFEWDEVEECLTITVAGVNISAFDPDPPQIYWSTDQTNWVPYVDCISGVTGTIYAISTVSYADDCPDIDISGSYDIPEPAIDCDEMDALVECVDAGNGNITFNRTGDIVCDPLLDLIKYRPVGGTDEDWLYWDNVTPVILCPIEVQRVIVCCDDECPPHCSEIITCNCLGQPCINDPEIIIDCSNGYITATAGGTFSATILTDVWTYQVNGGGYGAYTVGTPIAIDGVGTDTYDFKRVVTYEASSGCSPDTVEESYTTNDCSLNSPSIVVTDEGNDCVSAAITFGGGSTVSGYSFDYSIDGGVWQPYTEDDVVCGASGSYTFRLTVFYGDCCPNVTVYETFDLACVPPNPGTNANVTACFGVSGSVTLNLQDQVGDNDGGHFWAGTPSPTGGELGTVTLSSAGVFTFTGTTYDTGNPASYNCSAVVNVTVTVIDIVDAAGVNDTLSMCEDDYTTLSLQGLTGGITQGGLYTVLWTVSPVLPSGSLNVITGLYTPASGDGVATGLPPYVFTKTLTYTPTAVGVAPCTDTATVSINIFPAVNAGADNFQPYVEVCNTVTFNLQTLLSADADLTGDWTFFGYSLPCSGYAVGTFAYNAVPANPVPVNTQLGTGATVTVSTFGGNGCYMFRYEVDNGECTDTSWHIIEVITCGVACPGSVTISQGANCSFSSSLVSINLSPAPTYLWQYWSGTNWLDAPNINNTSTYTGLDGVIYRLIVTDNVNSCVYISNTLEGDCLGVACNIVASISLNGNSATGSWTGYNSNGLFVNYFFQYSTINTSNSCVSGCSGWVTFANGTVPADDDSVTVSIPAQAANQCIRFTATDSPNNTCPDNDCEVNYSDVDCDYIYANTSTGQILKLEIDTTNNTVVSEVEVCNQLPSIYSDIALDSVLGFFVVSANNLYSLTINDCSQVTYVDSFTLNTTALTFINGTDLLYCARVPGVSLKFYKYETDTTTETLWADIPALVNYLPTGDLCRIDNKVYGLFKDTTVGAGLGYTLIEFDLTGDAYAGTYTIKGTFTNNTGTYLGLATVNDELYAFTNYNVYYVNITTPSSSTLIWTSALAGSFYQGAASIEDGGTNC